MARDGRETESTDGAFIGAGGYVVFEKMRWRTPEGVVERICDEMGIVGFDLDAAAEDGASVAPRYYTAEEDCLMQVWTEGGWRWRGNIVSKRVQNVFLNPPWGAVGVSEKAREAATVLGKGSPSPFPGTHRFVSWAWEQSRRGLTVACLLPQALDTKWQRVMARLADEIWIGDRVRFNDCHGNEGPSPPAGHLLMIFRPHVPAAGWPGGPRVRWDWSW